MTKQVLYRIYCNDEGMEVEGLTIQDPPPDQCPNNTLHIVDASTKVILESYASNNLNAIVNPTSNDDINLGYANRSKWLNINTDTTFVCVDNTPGLAVWNQETTRIFKGNSDSPVSTTNINTLQSKLSLSTGVCEDNVKYYFGWSCEIKNSHWIGMTKVGIFLDGIEVVSSTDITRSWKTISGIKTLVPGSGIHTLDLRYRAERRGQAEIRRVEMVFWRMG